MFRNILATSLFFLLFSACLPVESSDPETAIAPSATADCCFCKKADGTSVLRNYQTRRECEQLGQNTEYESCERVVVRNSVCTFPNGVPDDTAAKCKCEELSGNQCALVQVFVSGSRRELGSAMRAPDAKCTMALCSQLFSVSYAAECQPSMPKQ